MPQHAPPGHVTLLSAGSRGDTQPYVALGLALKRRGFAVRVAAAELFAPLVEGQGLAFHPIRGDLAKAAADPALAAATQSGNPLRAVLSFNKLRELAFEMQGDYFAACQDTDAVIYHPGATIGHFAARARGVPSLPATPFPMTPTGAYPALLFHRGPRLGPAFNRLGHRLFEHVLWTTSKAPVARFWRERFGQLPPEFTNPYACQRRLGQPTLVGVSPHVFPRPSDWPDHVHATGFWFLDEPGWQPPAALLEFLEGPPPVYVGFGSVGALERAAETTDLVVAALRRAGERGVLATGWGGLSGSAPLGEDMFVLESAPHAWLFPRMAAVVHHGGAGTTAAGLRAGVPSVVVPHGLDQFAWGRRVHELGVGPHPLPRKALRAEALAAALVAARQPGVRAAAAALGQRIRAEAGAERAAALIAEHLAQPSARVFTSPTGSATL